MSTTSVPGRAPSAMPRAPVVTERTSADVGSDSKIGRIDRGGGALDDERLHRCRHGIRDDRVARLFVEPVPHLGAHAPHADDAQFPHGAIVSPYVPSVIRSRRVRRPGQVAGAMIAGVTVRRTTREQEAA
jgi:hypothetical protein